MLSCPATPAADRADRYRLLPVGTRRNAPSKRAGSPMWPPEAWKYSHDMRCSSMPSTCWPVTPTTTANCRCRCARPNLARPVARPCRCIFVAPFEHGEVGPGLFRPSIASAPNAAAGAITGSRSRTGNIQPLARRRSDRAEVGAFRLKLRRREHPIFRND